MYLSQEVDIFNDTIKNNIIMNREGISAEIFEKICRVTIVDEIVEKFPQKYDTFIDEKGYDLSQGEKQRIILARILVGNPEIVILDEVTSNLDYLTERRLLENINDFLIEKTVIFIAHRLSTVERCNKVIVMENGKIIEIGNHEELIRKKGKYYEMQQM